MPRLVDAPGAMPSGAARAQRALSSVVRLETVRYLWRNQEATRREISDATGLNHSSVRHELVVLAELGYVTSSQRGQRESYAFDGAQFSKDLGELLGYLMG